MRQGGKSRRHKEDHFKCFEICVLCLLLYSCHGAHTREEQEHADEDVNSNNSI